VRQEGAPCSYSTCVLKFITAMSERLIKGGDDDESVRLPVFPKTGKATHVAGDDEEEPVKELWGQKRIKVEPSDPMAASLKLTMATQETIV
jgi:hypothetical protein